MANWKVLILSTRLQQVIDKYLPLLNSHGCEIMTPPIKQHMRENELLSIITDIDGVIAGDDEFTEKVLLAAAKLKVISKWGTGIDSIDLKVATRLKIKVFNTPNAFSVPVADTVLGYILCFARGLLVMNSSMKQGLWKSPVAFPCLEELTLGVIGVGNIGKAVIHRAKVFGMRLLGHDISDVDAEFVRHTGVEMVSKEYLFQNSDFVSLNCSLTPSSHHLVNDATLKLMRSNCVLINTARGRLVDEDALIAALKRGSIYGAALDVFENEPLPADSPLLELKNVLLAPHNANSSPHYWDLVHKETVTNLLIGLGAISQS